MTYTGKKRKRWYPSFPPDGDPFKSVMERIWQIKDEAERVFSYKRGKYGGPGWSAGQSRLSTRDPGVAPKDRVDEFAMDHDGDYFDVRMHKDFISPAQENMELLRADSRFVGKNVRRALQGDLDAVAPALGVGLQGGVRMALQPFLSKKSRVGTSGKHINYNMGIYRLPARQKANDTGNRGLQNHQTEFQTLTAASNATLIQLGFNTMPENFVYEETVNGQATKKLVTHPTHPLLLACIDIIRTILKKEFGVVVEYYDQEINCFNPTQLAFEIAGVNQNFDITNITAAGASVPYPVIKGMTVYLRRWNNNGATQSILVPTVFNITNTTTLWDLGLSMCIHLQNNVANLLSQDHQRSSLYGLQFTKAHPIQVTPAANTHVHLENGRLHNLEYSRMRYKGTHTMYIQNQTQNSTTDMNMDNEPLRGRIFHFSTKWPIASSALTPNQQGLNGLLGPQGNLVTDNMGLFVEDDDIDGVWKYTANEARTFRHMPGTACFKNVTSWDDFVIEPHGKRSVTKEFVYEGTINKFLKKYGICWNNSIPFWEYNYASLMNSFGTSCLMFFEKDWKSGTSAPRIEVKLVRSAICSTALRNVDRFIPRYRNNPFMQVANGFAKTDTLPPSGGSAQANPPAAGTNNTGASAPQETTGGGA